MKVQINTAQVGMKVMDAWQKGLAALSEEILADCNEYCKEDQHGLIDSSLTHSRPQNGLLVWDKPYAKRQYWEIRTSLTPGRTWKWCETAKMHRLEKWKNLAQRGLDSNL